MECDDNGIEQVRAGCGRGVKRKCGTGPARVLRLAFSTALFRSAAARPGRLAAREIRAPSPHNPPPHDTPFMSNMDEISYWIYTKRAPCLFNYDNLIKKQSEQAQCSSGKPLSIKSKEEEPSPKKKKLKLLDEDSVSTEKQQNVYFKTPQPLKPTASVCKSDGAGSDVHFNVNTTLKEKKSKTSKLQRSCSTRVAKKNTKVATSTPKAVYLRRSQRTAQQKWNNHHPNHSFEIFDTSIVNGTQDTRDAVRVEVAKLDKMATSTPSKNKVTLPEKGEHDVLLNNGQFEDLSDVSGLTANYIRSTKMHSSKKPQKLKNQNSRTLSKHTKQKVLCNKMIMCVNKSMNTGFPDTTALNCSTDSSQNALKLVTMKNNEQSNRVNKSTSLLKFMDTKVEGDHSNSKNNKRESKNNLNISFQSQSSGTSRYPRRKRNNMETSQPNCSTNVTNSKANTTGRRYNMRKGTLNINRNENSEEKVISRTRSGRRRCLKLNVEETSPKVLQLNSSTEHVSSDQGVNVAFPDAKNNVSSRCLRSRTIRDKVGQFYKESSSEESYKKVSDCVPCALGQASPKCVRKVKKTLGRTGQSQSLSRDSVRNKSGFAACFSDSDSDSAPLKQRKFFC